MEQVLSLLFGIRSVPSEAILEFPGGVAGFMAERRFALLSTDWDSLYALQSTEHPGVVLLLADPFTLDAAYAIDLSPEEEAALGAKALRTEDLLVLCRITLPETGGVRSTVNFREPIVCNMATGRGLQLLRRNMPYAHDEPIDAELLLSGHRATEPDEAAMVPPAPSRTPKILVAIATYNRPIVTTLCLKALKPLRSADVRLVVYDDASTEYSKEDLSALADEVVRFDRRGGIERSRARALRDFLYRFPDFDLLYLTDNDTVHDPECIRVLRSLFRQQEGCEPKLPVCLYNSVFHQGNTIEDGRAGPVLKRKTAPGVSQCYTRAMVERIVDFLDHNPETETIYGWDYHWPLALGVPFLQTRTSYLEHFARDRVDGGLHAQISEDAVEAVRDFDRDRAQHPTPFLATIRPAIIRQILGLPRSDS